MSAMPTGEPAPSESSNGVPLVRPTLAGLARAVQAADPAAFLVLPRILRRVIKEHRRLVGFGLKVPHGKCYAIGRESLLEIVDKSELGLSEDATLPERFVLLAWPNPSRLTAATADDLLIYCWRLLFHARIHIAIEELAIPADVVRRRIRQLGAAEFEEIRTVLGQEGLLLPPRSDASIYTEFVAVYLELRRFAASFVPHYFPALADLEAVDALVGQDVDAERLFRATRPQGAPDPKDQSEWSDVFDVPPESESLSANLLPFLFGMEDVQTPDDLLPQLDPLPKAEGAAETKYRSLMRKSQRPASQGNVVGAAIYRARAERFVPPEFADRVRAAIKMDVYRLIRRLQAALELDAGESQPWHEALFALVGQTPRGFWTAEAKLLYDLQKVCIDHEREIYTVDLTEWTLSWGRRPIKRPLPNQRDVLMLKHLRSAMRRLAVVRLPDRLRRQLAVLIHEAQQRVEARLRQQLRPQINAALDDVELLPQNLPENVARKKLVEELLDRIGEAGYLTMGDLRDAISRNGLKLPDLPEPREMLHGDRLLRADRRLALLLDGVYRRGEFYLRAMQRISSLGFGTREGRFLTRFAAVPFGGAYVALAGLHHVWQWIAGDKRTSESMAEASRSAVEGGFRLTSPTVVLTLGLFLLCLINSAAFRRAVGRLLKGSYRVFRAAAIEPIRRIIQSPWLQRILHSRPFTLLFRLLIKPLLWTGLVWLLLPDETAKSSASLTVAIFLTINLLLNSREGRNLEELVLDEIVQGWHRFGLRAIAGLFWLIVDLFKGILETIERLMYGVDEWLRFKSGESNATLVTKAALGVVWFLIAYVLRFCVNVLIEPQVNPIKHFPVVTVSHKLLLPLIPTLAGVLELTFDQALAWTISAAVIWSIPGVFGFLVWELKENWRLYAANRNPVLSPVPIGSHGETMIRLLRPGFHSGTLPKRYAKLRRAERHARSGGNWRSVRKHLLALHHIEASIRSYVQREFVELLDESRSWQGLPVVLRRVRLGAKSVGLEIGCPEIAESDLEIVLGAESGWLVAGVTSPGWTGRLSPHRRDVLVSAILGLYKSAGVDLVRQQIEDQLGRPAPWYAIVPEELVVWPQCDGNQEVHYALRNGPWIVPQVSPDDSARQTWPAVERRKLVFGECPISWNDWVAIWSRDAAGKGHPRESAALACVLTEGKGG